MPPLSSSCLPPPKKERRTIRITSPRPSISGDCIPGTICLSREARRARRCVRPRERRASGAKESRTKVEQWRRISGVNARSYDDQSGRGARSIRCTRRPCWRWDARPRHVFAPAAFLVRRLFRASHNFRSALGAAPPSPLRTVGEEAERRKGGGGGGIDIRANLRLDISHYLRAGRIAGRTALFTLARYRRRRADARALPLRCVSVRTSRRRVYRMKDAMSLETGCVRQVRPA